jgi:hypothetical protein
MTKGNPMTSNCDKIFWGEIAPCDHLLQFYEDDHALIETLHGFVLEGLNIHESAVVIATPEHRDALEARLALSGLDIAAAQKRNQYVPLDAQEALSRFMVGGWPDEEKFAQVIDEILSRACSGGKCVRAFGEMVALLWADGHAGATVRLEHLWNKFCQAKGFTLFCAYPKSGITKKPLQSITEICAAHSKIYGLD